MSLSFWHTDLFIFVFPWVKNKLEYESKPFGDYWPFVFAQMGCLLPNIAQVQVEKKCILFIILLLRAGRAYTEGQSWKKSVSFSSLFPAWLWQGFQSGQWQEKQQWIQSIHTHTHTYTFLSNPEQKSGAETQCKGCVNLKVSEEASPGAETFRSF